MSRLTLQRKAALIFASTALVLMFGASAALGWGTGGETGGPNKGNHGHKNNQHQGSGPGGPTGATGPQGTPSVPQTTTPPPAPAAPAAPTPQVTPTQTPSQPVKAFGAPRSKKGKSRRTTGPGTTPESGGRQILAKAGVSKTVAIAPASERSSGLAETGLSPGLIALLGALCLGGGAFLLRRAMAR
jgi:hypothetical protein